MEHIDPAPLTALSGAGYIAVIAPIALGPDGPLNINADTVAGDIARAIGAAVLIFLTDVPGVKDGRATSCPSWIARGSRPSRTRGSSPGA